MSSEASTKQTLYMWGTNTSGSLMDLPKKVEVPTLVDWRLKLDGKICVFSGTFCTTCT